MNLKITHGFSRTSRPPHLEMLLSPYPPALRSRHVQTFSLSVDAGNLSFGHHACKPGSYRQNYLLSLVHPSRCCLGRAPVLTEGPRKAAQKGLQPHFPASTSQALPLWASNTLSPLTAQCSVQPPASEGGWAASRPCYGTFKSLFFRVGPATGGGGLLR